MSYSPERALRARIGRWGTATIEDRFWARVDDSAGPGGCWPCSGGGDGKGYAVVRIGLRVVRGHRYAYELLVGPVPDGLELDHLCRNRRCVNPAHLEAVTPVENTMRGFSPQAVNARLTHCRRGHRFTPDNTRIETSGSRRCLTCLAAYRDASRGDR